MTAPDDLNATIEQFRETNRRLHRRLQLLEGWWQRKVDRVKNERSMYFYFLVKDTKDRAPNLAAIEEAAYQRGFQDGYEQRFQVPKRAALRAGGDG